MEKGHREQIRIFPLDAKAMNNFLRNSYWYVTTYGSVVTFGGGPGIQYTSLRWLTKNHLLKLENVSEMTPLVIKLQAYFEIIAEMDLL